MFKIGEFSRLANTSIRMLRHYDKLGLLTPGLVDEENGFRYYSASQLERVNKINRLKSLGFSLSVTKEILDEADLANLERFFELRKRELEEELAKVAMQSKMLDQVTEILKEETKIMDYHVVLKEIAPRKVMSLRRIIPTFQDEGSLWEALYGELQRQNVKMANPPMGVTIFHDEEYKEENVDVEVQSSIEGDYQDTAEVKFFTAPAMQVASVTFHGPYEQMRQVTEAIARWLEVNHYQISGPMLNIMHVSPAQDPNPENWVTEACFQVKPSA